MSCSFQFYYSLRVGGGERTGCKTHSLEKCFNRPAFISHPYRFNERKGVGLSLITEKHSETNGKRLVDIKIQTKTDQTRNFLQPILDTSHSASVRTVHQGPHGARRWGDCPLGHSFLWVSEEVLSVVAFLHWGFFILI